MKRRHSPAYRKAIDPTNAHWTSLRWTRYRLQGGRCAICHLPLNNRFEAHHIKYDNMGRETVNDIRAVHRGTCHAIADRIRRMKNRKRR